MEIVIEVHLLTDLLQRVEDGQCFFSGPQHVAPIPMLLADTLRVQHSTITCEAQGFKFKFWEIDHTAAEEDIVVMFPVREHRVSQSGHSSERCSEGSEMQRARAGAGACSLRSIVRCR